MYKIIQANSLENLEALVNEKLKEGWQIAPGTKIGILKWTLTHPVKVGEYGLFPTTETETRVFVRELQRPKQAKSKPKEEVGKEAGAENAMPLPNDKIECAYCGGDMTRVAIGGTVYACEECQAAVLMVWSYPDIP